MSTISILGLNLNVEPDGKVARPTLPGLTANRWNVNIVAGKLETNLELTIDATATKIIMRVKIHVVHQDEIWHLEDGAPEAGSRRLTIEQGNQAGGGTLSLYVGPLQLVGDATVADAITVKGGKIGLSFGSASTHILRDDQLPLAISPRKGRAVPNLGAMRIELEDGFCAVHTGVRAKPANGNISWLFEHRHSSRAHILDLSIARETLQLSFDTENTAVGLPLNADLRERTAAVSSTNPVLIPIRADAYRLIVDLGRKDKDTILTAATLAGPDGNGGPKLTFFGLFSSDNRPVQVKLNQPLSLRARLQQTHQVASLLIAPVLPTGKGIRAALASGPIHGLLAKARVASKGTAHLCCEHETPHTSFPGAPIAKEMLCDVTLPWIEFDTSLEHPKAGDAYTKDIADTAGSKDVDVWKFAGAKIGLALVPDHLARHATTDTIDIRKQHYDHLNTRATGLTHQLCTATHDTNLVERPVGVQDIKLTQLFAPRVHEAGKITAAPATQPTDGLQPAAYSVVRDYGMFKVEVTIPAGKAPDYLILRKSASADFKIIAQKDLFAPDPHRFPGLEVGMPKDHNEPATDLPLAVLKLSERYSLEEIFRLENLGQKPESAKFLVDVLDQPIKAKAWLGLIVFNLDFVFSKNPIIRPFLPGPKPDGTHIVRFRYLALTPSKTHDTEGISFNGRVWYQNQEKPNKPAKLEQAEDDEATYRFDFVDALWRDSRLVRFDTGGTLAFQSVFGMQHPNHQRDPENWRSIKLRGRLEEPPKNEGGPRIRFSAEIDREIPLLEPRGSPGLIEQVSLKGAEVVFDPEKGARVDFDGNIKLGKLDLDPKFNDFFNVDSDDKKRIISFEKLGLGLPKDMNLNLNWLKISYPAVKLNVNVPHFQLFNLPQLSLKIKNIGVDWENKFDWGKTLQLKNWKADADEEYIKRIKRIFLIDIRLTAADLPELAGKLFDKLNLDFSLGLGQLPSGPDFKFSPDALKIGLSAGGFDNFHLDLARIIELHVKSVEFEKQSYGGIEAPWIIMKGVELKILDKTIISDLTLAFFTVPNGRRGFICFFGNPLNGEKNPSSDKESDKNKLLHFTWLLIGNNLTMDETLAKDLVKIDTDTTGGWNTPDKTRDNIANAIKDKKIFPLSNNSVPEPWIFAAGFSVLDGFLEGKFLFQDRAYYGLMLHGKLFKDWFGYELAISCLYIKRERSEEDSFIVSFTVPAVQTGSFRFMGGVVSVEIAANGSYVLDIGFPWLTPGGLRDWNRTLGAICTPYQGSGGLYIRYRKTKTVLDDKNYVIFAGGYALQAGLGASFGGGIFEVWVRAGIYVIAEGAVVLNRDNKALEGLRFVGAVGILVEGHGSLRWWIISANVSVIAQAEARAIIAWGIDPEDIKQPRVNDVVLQLDFTLSARASANACIGSGWFKVCRGISTSIEMPFKHRLVLK